MTIAHPECPANIREHSDFVGGTEAMIKYVGGFTEPTDFLVATEANMLWQLQTQVPAAPLPSGAGHHLRLQQVPAHGPQHAGEAPRLPARTASPEITWQPEFDRAKEVLTRSLLNPPAARVSSRWGIERGEWTKTKEPRSILRGSNHCGTQLLIQAATGLRRIRRQRPSTGRPDARRSGRSGAGTD